MVRARILYERLVNNFPTSGRYWRLYVEQEVKIAWSYNISSLSIPSVHKLHIDVDSSNVMVLRKFISSQIPFNLSVIHACPCVYSDVIESANKYIDENSTAYGNTSILFLLLSSQVNSNKPMRLLPSLKKKRIQ